jgi:hypothetical protein
MSEVASREASTSRHPVVSVIQPIPLILRAEGLAALVAAAGLYGHAGFSWGSFGGWFLAPDLAMLAYALGPRVGAAFYNLAHTYVFAVALALLGFLTDLPWALAAGLIWSAHIGFDRMFGYGLKYGTRFGDTHLGRLAE